MGAHNRPCRGSESTDPALQAACHPLSMKGGLVVPVGVWNHAAKGRR